MNWLLIGIGNLLASVIAYFGRKSSVIAISIATYIFLLGILITSLNALINSILGYSSIPAWIAQGVGMFIPADFSLVLSAIIAAKATKAAYGIAVDKLRLINTAS